MAKTPTTPPARESIPKPTPYRDDGSCVVKPNADAWRQTLERPGTKPTTPAPRRPRQPGDADY